MILLHNELKKANDVPKLLMENAALWRLRKFLNEKEPELVYWLVTLWRHQGDAITYKELREWILNGEISQEAIEDWQQDYSKFVAKYMAPLYSKAIEEANSELKEKFLENYNFTDEHVQLYTAQFSARFVTNSTNEQITAIRQVVRRAMNMKDITVDGLARAIRPMVGLDIRQTRANMNYYEQLINHGMSEKRALDKSIRYGARQHRHRAYRIARTETAFAYNRGEHEGIKRAQNLGLMGRTTKKWCTADDERVCSICAGLDGKEIEMEDRFNFPTNLPASYQITPPAHPHCRCAVLYLEKEPPTFTPQFEVSGPASMQMQLGNS